MPKQKQKYDDKAPTHTPVMVQEILKYLAPARGERYLDLTAGYGGHASAVEQAAGQLGQITLVDRDSQATEALTERFSSAEILHQDFLSASEDLLAKDAVYDMVLADLGVSSPHLNEASRGFSFARSGPLDMRMDQRQADTAATVVNQASAEELRRILSEFGEEKRAGQIAQAIVSSRPISSTAELAQIVENAVPKRLGRKIHPATKTFQALRVFVNDELNQLRKSLPLMCQLLAPGGRLAVISFHSLEDRIVKQYFREVAGSNYDSEFELLTKKPIVASQDEIVSNPRARSAKLRVSRKR
jgi:16S rRNA (cytosine1402-N4)-methyltransferase